MPDIFRGSYKHYGLYVLSFGYHNNVYSPLPMIKIILHILKEASLGFRFHWKTTFPRTGNEEAR